MSAPVNNMGALITTGALKPASNQVLIDWLSWTVKDTDPHAAIAASGLKKLSFSSCEYGGMGYRKSLRCGNIVVFYDGASNMGCHISLTGQGCREYETATGGKSDVWYRLLLRLKSINANVTRLDIANDNVDGQLCLKKLEWNIRRKNIRSVFKGGHKVEKFKFSTETKKQGKTIYLGSMSSRIKFRFYDKAAQNDIDAHWIRCECQIMAERAHEAINYLLDNMSPGVLLSSILRRYFSIINKNDTNTSRCTLQQWWSDWLDRTEKVKLSTYKAIKSIEETIDHIKKQYATSFAMIKTYMRRSNRTAAPSLPSFLGFIDDLVETGMKKITTKHENIIISSLLETELEYCELPF